MDIYSVSNWMALTDYAKNSIVTNGNYYYYAKEQHTSSLSFSDDLANNKWGGVLNFNGKTRPFFEWKFSYRYSLDIEPKVKSIRFGDGYEQLYADGINNILLPFEVSFENRDLAEYTAILHFFHARNGSERFYLIPPAPYNVVKLFVCPKWQPTQDFYNDYTIRATLREMVA